MLADESLESIETVNGILRACVASRESLYAQEVYDTLPRLGIDSNIESLDLMLSLAVAEIQYPSDRSLFLQAVHEKMISSEKPVFDQRILKSILTSFAKKGDADGAILAKGLIGNYGCVPRVNEYNSILHCYIRLREMDKAIDWLQEMRRSGVRPDRSTYVLLMQSFAQQRMPRHAEALFRQLLRDGIQPDLAVCNYLLMAYEQGRMERRCLQLYKSMLNDRSIGVDQISFTCMFNAIFHSDKARLEGGEGLQGEGTVLNDLRFLNKISEPIGQSFRPTLENDGSRTISTSAAPSRPSSNPCIVKKHYQFDKIPSTTEFLNPRTLFRDMIIVGIRPSRSLYSNILRAFFAWHDYAGATVALQALIDHYSLKPTPKMNAIVVSWVLEEHNRRNDNNENTPISKGELSKLVNMMSRTRGLIQILEKLAYDQNYGQDFKTEKNMDNLAPISLSPEDNTTTTVTGPRANSRIGFPPQNQGQIANQIEAAKMEMGGDLLELFSTSPIAGSSWSTKKDDPTQIDLNDFERWFQLYSTRASYDRSRKSKDVST
ncbi:hypothetical protein BCR41DRAFT_358251 [Lobosporangium transversale]|uniref:Pentacotripeptide-repeat region of PRORP domain-containing protein n=1 Tax=Lobosporangium transversale TaxID=64571 RepID=A0A1Y2GJX3_9FUNG|nr:hypothetical protein BCR41DRAFT_358251 [Lobosporangium transversale]ORZ09664.1 hypothetical protein BCR41DRAFT_358251 [Lobosporangium transversale]|eukprot:XP_021878934.1 hypothetical protein BCR41DRAFT_358251 [Lobosporangium transversale]